MLKLMHGYECAIAGADQVVGADPRAEHILAATLEVHTGKQAGVMPGIRADAQRVLAGAHIFLARFNGMFQVGLAAAVGALGPIDGQFVFANLFKGRVGQQVWPAFVAHDIHLRCAGGLQG